MANRVSGWVRVGLVVLVVLIALHPVFAATTAKVFHAEQFGAKGDGVALDTGAIQRAIDAAAKKGGVVEFRAGTYLTGSLFVKSGVTLKVDKGVTLMGSQRI